MDCKRGTGVEALATAPVATINTSTLSYPPRSRIMRRAIVRRPQAVGMLGAQGCTAKPVRHAQGDAIADPIGLATTDPTGTTVAVALAR